MDRDSEEFESMGILGIYREAYKVTLSQKKIFSQIALALLLPLALILLAQTGIPVPPANETQFNPPVTVVDEYQTGNFENEYLTGYYEYGYNFQAKFSEAKFSSETITPYASKAICWLLISILAVPSASAVVYTVACIYSSRDITFKKAMSVVPSVWKRLAMTFLWNILIALVYNTTLLAILFLVVTKILPADPKLITLLSAINIICFISSYVIGNMYITLIWLSSSITTILEDISGSKAVKKGKDLIKGKLCISLFNYLTLEFCCQKILSVFFSSVLHGEGVAMVGRVSLGIVCLVLMVILLHFGLVIQTVIYLVCKSYHKESISLADHLDGYLPVSYTPLGSN